MRFWLCFALFVLTIGKLSSQTETSRAFSSSHEAAAADTAHQNDWEKEFRALPDPKLMREYMQRLSARPHHLGSPYGKENAEWLLAKLQEWGLEAQIETFHALFPSPKERVVEMLAPTKFVAGLQEPALEEDPTSKQLHEQLPTYNAYSIDGEVTAPLVYVNYGIPSDYEELERLGISVKGCIVIARYGASWRGIKPKVAAEHGAVGCIIYSDPIDDGYHEGEVYPKGPYRPSTGVQRGSVMDMPTYPGDPLTPGVGATANAKRLDRKEVKTFTTIPVLPISYGDAQPLLAALTGPVAPEGWRGALPMTYHIGPGPAKVRLKLQFNWEIKPIYNVIAKIPGTIYPDEWIIRGNHHDAWVNGAEDPISGMVALLEEARAFSVLLKQGWKPKRTLIYCAWDAEEQGLIGSTEWVETHAEELREKAALYINTDGNGRGYLFSAGSHSLEKFLNGVAKEIEDPETKLTVWKRSQLRGIAGAGSPEARKEFRNRADLRINALGSGSDYTAFLDHLGIASMHLGYGGEGGGGIYHSVYDSFHWYTTFSDTNFVYGRALAQTAGTAAMRFAEADLLPYDFNNLAETIGKYLEELKKLATSKREEIVERNTQIQEGVFAAINDPRQPRIAPAREKVPPFLNFAPLENACAALSQSAERYSKAVGKFRESGKPVPRGLNKKLLQAERKLTSNEGLPLRPWFKHQIYAPGYYTGYGVKTLPAVREAIEQKQWQEVEPQIARVSTVLLGMADHIDGMTKNLEQAVQ